MADQFGGVVVVLGTQRPVGGESRPLAVDNRFESETYPTQRAAVKAEVEALERLLQHKARRKRTTQMYFRSNLNFNSVVPIKFTVMQCYPGSSVL